jgi:uncharacterized phage protein gp47/JayE
MTIEFPANRKEVVNRVKTDIQLSLPTVDPFIPKSVSGALATGVGGRDYDLYLQLKELLKQMFPDTATGDFLIRWGSYKNIFPLPATFANGNNNVMAFGIPGTLIDGATSLTSLAGNIYLTGDAKTISLISLAIINLTRAGSVVTALTSSEHFLSTGQQVTIAGANETDYNGTFFIITTSTTTFTYTINTEPSTPASGDISLSFFGALLSVSSQNTGVDQNLENGSQLTLTTPIVGVNTPLLVTEAGISGGTDAEVTTGSSNPYRSRVLFAYQNPFALWSKSYLEAKAMAVNGVTRVWVFPIAPFVGYVSIYFTRDADSDSIIPDSSEILAVRNAITLDTPVNGAPSNMSDAQLIVDAPTPVLVDFVFSSITPDTTEMRNAITSTLNFLFRDKSVNVGENVTALNYNSAIINTIDETGARLTNFTLTAPIGDIPIVIPELAILNSVTFT